VSIKYAFVQLKIHFHLAPRITDKGDIAGDDPRVLHRRHHQHLHGDPRQDRRGSILTHGESTRGTYEHKTGARCWSLFGILMLKEKAKLSYRVCGLSILCRWWHAATMVVLPQWPPPVSTWRHGSKPARRWSSTGSYLQRVGAAG
jgi:hypothetical protein